MASHRWCICLIYYTIHVKMSDWLAFSLNDSELSGKLERLVHTCENKNKL